MIRAGGTILASVALITGVLVAGTPPAGASPAWSITPSANPTGSRTTALAGVACVSSTSCFAVGRAQITPSYRKTLVEHWNGSNWAIMTSPNPANSVSAELSSVACVDTTNCIAVGHWTFDPPDSTNRTKALVERWNGSAWSLMTTPDLSGPDTAELASIACAAATNCFAVGSFGDNPLVEHWNGSTWSLTASPKPAGAPAAELSGVACPTATYCFAVGDSGSGYIGPGSLPVKSLVMRWNGSAWSLVTSPNTNSSIIAGQLLGVACRSTTSCFAVGTSQNSSSFLIKTFVEHWNGRNWLIVSSPSRAGTNNTLTAVSCSSTTNCFAVGNSQFGNTKTLIEHWNGTQWSFSASPNRGSNSSLAAVSCRNPTNCFAVGSSGLEVKTLKSLVEHYA